MPTTTFLLIALTVTTLAASGADLSGKWKGTIAHGDGAGKHKTFEMDLKQDGNVLSGAFHQEGQDTWTVKTGHAGGEHAVIAVTWQANIIVLDVEIAPTEMHGVAVADERGSRWTGDLRASRVAQVGGWPRGKYIVEELARCQDCHTPRLANGELDRTRWLKGGPLSFTSVQKDWNWETRAPDLTSSGRIAGQFPDKLLETLITGHWPGSRPPYLPMPQYHMDRSDAEAVVEYLKTIK